MKANFHIEITAQDLIDLAKKQFVAQGGMITASALQISGGEVVLLDNNFEHRDVDKDGRPFRSLKGTQSVCFVDLSL